MISTPSLLPFTSILGPTSRVLQISLGSLTFSLLSLQFHFANPTSYSQPWSILGWLPRLLSGVTEGCPVAKWLSHFLQTFSLGTAWTINLFFFFLNVSNSEPSCIRLFANMNLQYQVYTKNVYFSDQDHDGALIKYRTELNLSALGNHHIWLICHIISFVHSTCLGLLNIDQNRSKILSFGYHVQRTIAQHGI